MKTPLLLRDTRNRPKNLESNGRTDPKLDSINFDPSSIDIGSGTVYKNCYEKIVGRCHRRLQNRRFVVAPNCHERRPLLAPDRIPESWRCRK